MIVVYLMLYKKNCREVIQNYIGTSLSKRLPSILLDNGTVEVQELRNILISVPRI